MPIWEENIVELDRNGIFCSFGTAYIEKKETNDYSIFITKANGESLLDYCYDKNFLELLNEHFSIPFTDFEEFLNVNSFKIKENYLGKYLVLRNKEDENFNYKNAFNEYSYIASFSFISKCYLKFLAFLLAKYLNCKNIYGNNEVVIFAENYFSNEKLQKINIVDTINNEVFSKMKNEKFDLKISEIYKNLIGVVGKLNLEFNKTGEITNIINQNNPAYMQKLDKYDFLTNHYFYFDKKNCNHIKVNFIIENENLGLIEKITKKDEKKQKEIFSKVELNKKGIYINTGIIPNSGKYGIYICRADGKSLLEYCFKSDFLPYFSKNFENFNVNTDSFYSFLKRNNFNINDENIKKLELYETKNIDNKSEDIIFLEIFAFFLGIVLAEYLKVDIIYVNSQLEDITSLQFSYNNEEKIYSLDLMENIKQEMELLEDFTLNLEKIKKIFKTEKINFKALKFLETSTFKNFENVTKALKKEFLKHNKRIEIIENIYNPAYIFRKYGIDDILKEEYIEIEKENELHKINFKIGEYNLISIKKQEKTNL